MKTPISSINQTSQFQAQLQPHTRNANNPMTHSYGSKISNVSSAINANRAAEAPGMMVTRSSTSSALDQEDERRRKEDLAYK